MIKLIAVFLVLIQLFTSIASCQSFDPETQNWINNHVHAVSDLNADNDSYDDFEPLSKAIGNRNVVLLGEQTHGDGTTFEAKVRIAKFLHKEMGFNTLVFESDFYSAHKLWSEVRKIADREEIFQQGIHKRWATVHQVQPIFFYAQKSLISQYPLEISGMDILFNEEFAQNDLLSDFNLFMNNNYPNMLNTVDYKFLTNQLRQLLLDQSYLPEEKIKNKLLDLLNNYIGTLRRVPSKNKWNTRSFWAQVLYSFKSNIINNFSRLAGTYVQSTFFSRRDRLMAENLNWILKENKKVIVWSSVTHNMRMAEKSLLRQMGWQKDTKFMGEYLKELIGQEEIFHLTFTGYEGSYMDIYEQKIIEFATPSSDSIEAFLNNAGLRFGYLVLNEPDVPTALTMPFKSSVIFNTEYLSRWRNSIDTIFFTKDMEHSIRN